MDVNKELKKQEVMDAGVWVDLSSGGKILVATIYQEVFRKKYQAVESRHRKLHKIRKDKDLPEELGLKVLVESTYGTVIKDWSGIEKDGKALEFNKENYQFLMENIYSFRRDVSTHIGDDAIFDQEDREVAEGN